MPVSFNLSKGVSFNLAKAINAVSIQAGWEPATKPGEQFDLDLWVVGLQSGKLYNGGSHVVAYFNPGLNKTPSKGFITSDKSITHTGDNRDGKGDVAEQIDIDFSKLPTEIDEIAVFYTIYDYEKRKQSFGRVNNTFVRIMNTDTKEELCHYDPHMEFADSTAIHIGSLIKDNNVWSFKAVGAGAGPGSDANTILGNY